MCLAGRTKCQRTGSASASHASQRRCSRSQTASMSPRLRRRTTRTSGRTCSRNSVIMALHTRRASSTIQIHLRGGLVCFHIVRCGGVDSYNTCACLLHSLLNGGVIIVSKWPIIHEAQHIYRNACHYSDCLAAKGVKYARVLKRVGTTSKIFNVFATHMQVCAALRLPRKHQQSAKQTILSELITSYLFIYP